MDLYFIILLQNLLIKINVKIINNKLDRILESSKDNSINLMMY